MIAGPKCAPGSDPGAEDVCGLDRGPPHPSAFNRRGRKRGRPVPGLEDFIVETDLPEDIPIGVREIAAVERLLGVELDRLLRGELENETGRRPAAE